MTRNRVLPQSIFLHSGRRTRAFTVPPPPLSPTFSDRSYRRLSGARIVATVIAIAVPKPWILIQARAKRARAVAFGRCLEVLAIVAKTARTSRAT